MGSKRALYARSTCRGDWGGRSQTLSFARQGGGLAEAQGLVKNLAPHSSCSGQPKGRAASMLPDVASRMHLVNARCLCMPRRIDHQSEDRQSGLPSASLRRAASLLIDRRRMGMKNDRDAKKPPGQCRSFRLDSDPTLAQRDQHGPKTVFLRLRTASLVQPGLDDWIRSCPLPGPAMKKRALTALPQALLEPHAALCSVVCDLQQMLCCQPGRGCREETRKKGTRGCASPGVSCTARHVARL
jgi:hypothetical protein